MAPLMTEAVPPAARTGVWDDASRWVELFRELAAGHPEKLGQLYDLASRRLYGLALWRTGNRELAADVVQEVFVRIAERRERLGEVRDPRWWLLSVTHRLAVDAVRRALCRRAEPLDEHAHLAAEAVDDGRAVDARHAWTLLGQLSAKQREVVYLHDAAGMSHAEIGRCLGVPTFTAASRYRLALKALRGLLGSTT